METKHLQIKNITGLRLYKLLQKNASGFTTFNAQIFGYSLEDFAALGIIKEFQKQQKEKDTHPIITSTNVNYLISDNLLINSFVRQTFPKQLLGHALTYHDHLLNRIKHEPVYLRISSPDQRVQGRLKATLTLDAFCFPGLKQEECMDSFILHLSTSDKKDCNHLFLQFRFMYPVQDCNYGTLSVFKPDKALFKYLYALGFNNSRLQNIILHEDD